MHRYWAIAFLTAGTDVERHATASKTLAPFPRRPASRVDGGAGGAKDGMPCARYWRAERTNDPGRPPWPYPGCDSRPRRHRRQWLFVHAPPDLPGNSRPGARVGLETPIWLETPILLLSVHKYCATVIPRVYRPFALGCSEYPANLCTTPRRCLERGIHTVPAPQFVSSTTRILKKKKKSRT
jgi:hypothetical protein